MKGAGSDVRRDAPTLGDDERVVRLQHAMDNRNFRARNLVHCDVTRVIPLARPIREEEQVTAVERGFH